MDDNQGDRLSVRPACDHRAEALVQRVQLSRDRQGEGVITTLERLTELKRQYRNKNHHNEWPKRLLLNMSLSKTVSA